MVSHWSFGDSKSPQVSRTLLSIMTDLNNVLVKMVSSCSSYFQVFHSFYQSFMDCPSAPTTIGITVTFMLYSFISLVWSTNLSLFSLFLFSLRGLPGKQSPLFGRNSPFFFFFFFFFCSLSLGLVVWPRVSDPFVSQNPSLCFILQDGFCVQHISFIRMVKFQFFAQIPMYYHIHLVVSGLILFLAINYCIRLLLD